MPAGCSATPLTHKHSLTDGLRVLGRGMPDSIDAAIAESGVTTIAFESPPFEHGHLFTRAGTDLKAALVERPPVLAPGEEDQADEVRF